MFRLLIFLIFSCDASINFAFKNNDLTELTDFITQFIHDNSNEYKNILFVYQHESVLADTLIYNLNKYQYSSNYFTMKLNENLTIEHEFNNDYDPNLIVIIVNKIETIYDVVYGLELFTFWSVRGKFLFIIDEIVEINTELIKNIFTSLWERQMLKVLICFWTDKVQLFTYNPFSNEFSINVFNNNASLELFKGRISDMHMYPLKLYNFDYAFPNRLIKTMKNGKEILYGFDGIFYDTVAHVLNASLEIHHMSEDFSVDFVKNVDVSLSFMDYMKALSDIYDYDGLFNAIYTVLPENEMDHIVLFDRNDLIVLVPEAKLIPRYMYLFLIIQPTVLYCILISFIVLSLVMALTEKIMLYKFNLFQICLDNYRLLLNESPPTRPKRSRILFSVWSLQNLVIVTLFQSFLISTLLKPKYYKNVDTINDFLETNFKIYGAEPSIALIKNLEDQNEEFINRFNEAFTKSINYGASLDWIYNYIDENAVLVMAEALWTTDPRKQTKYHVMEERAMNAYLWYNFRKDRNFYPEIRDISYWINEAGLNIYWRTYNYGEKFLDSISDKHNTTYILENNEANSKLKLEHLEGAFLFLLVGSILSLFVFVLECCIFKLY